MKGAILHQRSKRTIEGGRCLGRHQCRYGIWCGLKCKNTLGQTAGVSSGESLPNGCDIRVELDHRGTFNQALGNGSETHDAAADKRLDDLPGRLISACQPGTNPWNQPRLAAGVPEHTAVSHGGDVDYAWKAFSMGRLAGCRIHDLRRPAPAGRPIAFELIPGNHQPRRDLVP